MQLVHAAAKAPDCELDVLEVEMSQVAPGGEYEVLGHVILGESGAQDPTQPAYRAEVRSRACGMGGEAVAILATASNAAGGLSAGGTSVDYVVLRKYQAPGEKKPPTKF